VKGPTPFPFLGTMGYMFFEETRKIDYHWYKKYGKVYGDYMGVMPNLVITDSTLAKQILVSDFHIFNQGQKLMAKSKLFDGALTVLHGPNWKRVRAAVSPTFTTFKLRRTLEHLDKPIKHFFDNLDTLIAEGKEDQIAFKELSKGYALDTIAKFVFAMEINSFKQKDDIFVKMVMKLTRFNILPVLLVQILPKFVGDRLGDRVFDSQACDYFFRLTSKIVKERRENPDVKYKDFIELLLESSNEMSEQDIITQCLLFFFAGMETVSTGISIILSDLAIHQDVQERLLNEISEKMGDNPITYESLNSLEYLDAVIHESFRMTPVLNRLVRHPQQDYELGDTGITLKAGKSVMVSVYAIHHDEEIFPEPFVYKPERFMGDNRKDLVNRYWFTFGDGPRNCVGIRFAMMELKYFIAKLIQNYHIQMAKGCPVPVKYRPMLFLLDPKDLRFTFERRD
jgi:cytochrome P450